MYHNRMFSCTSVVCTLEVWDLTNEDVLFSIAIIEILFVSKKFVSFFMTQILQWLGGDSPYFSLIVLVDVFFVYHYLEDRFRARLRFWTRPFRHHRCLLYLLLLHKQECFLFLCIVLVCQVQRHSDLFSEPSHCLGELFFFKLIQDIFMFNNIFLYSVSLVSRFCVMSVSLTSFLFWLLVNLFSFFHVSDGLPK